MDKQSISEFIKTNSTEIVESINRESIDVYNFIQNEFKTTDITTNFVLQFVYRSFYRLDNAGLSREFKVEYFRVLQETRNKEEFDFEEIAGRLYHFPNLKGQNTLQFSFITKLLNTVDNNLPIYDSEVAKLFEFNRPQMQDFSRKLDVYLNQLKCIQYYYEDVLTNSLISNVIQQFDSYFPNSKLTEMKKLDFIFWSAGKLKRKYQILGDDGFHSLSELDEIDQMQNGL